MNLLGSEDALDGLARASGVPWYGHVLRGDVDDVLKERWNLKWWKKGGVGDQRWRRHVEVQSGWKKEDDTDRTKWPNDLYKLSGKMR